MNLSVITNAFVNLGNDLLSIPEETVKRAGILNPWFTPASVKLAADNWANSLQRDKIEKWLSHTDTGLKEKTAGIIMAGNIPMVGLHDLLCAVASGLKVSVKLSSHDEELMKYAIASLQKSIPELKNRISTEGKLNGINYLIATGSNNSARYFEYYFRDVPSLIRKNRTSLAVLSGEETDATLTLLADDIYSYFGLGCRNVTHLILPRHIDFHRLHTAYDKYMDIVNHHKYYNNYMYHKSILLMNLDKHYDNGFMLFQEKEELHAPVATLNYHFYDDIAEVKTYLDQRKDELQCVVSGIAGIEGAIPFGTSQQPSLNDYADKVDVLAFLN